MSTPVAMIPYTNMAPYRQLGAPAGCHFVPLVPRQSVNALMEGAVAAAAVPVGGLAQLGDRVEMAGCCGIGARGVCMSVMLFSRFPFDALAAPRTLRITSETASSVRLLYLLLGEAVGFERLPLLAPQGAAPDAELLIGDRALIKGQDAATANEFPYVTDLSQRWLDTCGLPFVFARWVVRRDVPEAVKGAIGRWLDEFREREAQLVEQAVASSAERLNMAPGVIRQYFRVIRRCLDETDVAGQERFMREIAALRREPLFHDAR